MSVITLLEMLVEAAGGYIINYDSLSDLNKTLKELRVSPGFSNQAEYLIVANIENDLVNISTYLWYYRIYKSVILLPTNNTVNLYELDLKGSKCGVDIKPIQINECYNGTFKYHLNLFSVDMKTIFYKCPLRIIWTETLPWVYSVNASEPGIYIELLNLFGEVSQFEIVYMPETDVYRQELGGQYSFETMMEDLDRDYADVFVGLVSAAPRAYLETILLFALCSCLFTLLAVTTIDKRRFGSLEKNCLTMVSINLNMGTYVMPRSFKLRWFLGSVLIYSLIISAIIQGRFYSSISSPIYENAITNLEQLIDSDIAIKFSGGLKIIFIKHVLYEYFDKTLQTIIECGFMEKFISAIKFKYSLQQYVNEESKIFQISMNHMEGPFLILIIGIILGWVAFSCELFLFLLAETFTIGRSLVLSCCGLLGILPGVLCPDFLRIVCLTIFVPIATAWCLCFTRTAEQHEHVREASVNKDRQSLSD
ncbi:hypothetical protein NQ318_008501 [Aromia moschata]|uniref:Uncharacterized protein n=1 Tax=Aromia moschata TaxID=1265417 RepID=A0AAV8X887_9CUCU|nr:hypothetical protein NQ318_008501 [Aromia moschata]